MIRKYEGEMNFDTLNAFMESDWRVWNEKLISLTEQEQALVMISRLTTDVGALSLSLLRKYGLGQTDHKVEDSELDYFLSAIWMNVQYLATLMNRSLRNALYEQMKVVQKSLKSDLGEEGDAEVEELIGKKALPKKAVYPVPKR